MLKYSYINGCCFILLFVVILLDVFKEVSPFLYVIIVLFWVIITGIGSFSMSWNYHVNALTSNRLCKEKKVAITFDDGPHEKFTPEVLQVLKKYQAKATFFCIGKQIEKSPNIIERIIKEGHTIGNHSYSHSKFNGFFSTKKVTEEIEATNDLVESIIGKKMNLFRPPFGVTNSAIAKAVRNTKHKVIGWNIRPFDTVQKNEQIVINKIKKGISPGAVILLHDTNHRTPIVLEQLLVFLQEKGYKTTTINELFSIEAYA